MSDYRDHAGRTEPDEEGCYYIGNLRRGSVVTWGGPPVKIVSQNEGSTTVTRGRRKRKEWVGTKQVTKVTPKKAWTISRGTVVRRARDT